MTSKILIHRVRVRDFRNLESIDFEPAARVNVLAGDNGQGKTSVLEALYFVATSRSFRTDRLAEAVREGTPNASVQIDVLDEGYPRQQRAAIVGSRRSMLLDGKKPVSLSAYAVRTPVVVFHPGDLSLVGGAAATRRTLLDRLALFTNVESAAHRSRYRQAMRERQITLERRGMDTSELDAFEALMAEYGGELTKIRGEVSEKLASALAMSFGRTASPDLVLDVRYVPGGATDRSTFLQELRRRRRADARRKLATFGPQRDELEFSIDGRSARKHASQGQQRILALAIKLAELECVARVRDADPILLLDDISSELDPERAGAVYKYLRDSPNQVFVTTTRPELFATPGVPSVDRADFSLNRGQLTRRN